MKKKILTMAMVLFSGVLFAQTSPVREGQLQMNFGFGMSNYGLPIYVGLDYGVHPDITIGGELSFYSFDKWGYHHSVTSISGNANYHFNTALGIPSNWDFYAGLNLGFSAWNSDAGYSGSHTSGLGIGAQVGARYYWDNKWGINLEFGGGNEFNGGKVGVSVKF